jgi:hypothetical protein
MKRFLIAAACVAVFVPAAAFAQDFPDGQASPASPSAAAPGGGTSPALPALTGYAVGTIASIDVAAGTVTLDDGKTFSTQANLALNTFKVGQKVTIAFMNADGTLMASEVTPAAQGEAAPAPEGGN